MGYELGIDVGTTFTAAAVKDAESITMLSLGERQPEMPSVVAVTSSGLLVGDAAERVALHEPSTIAREFKRRFGDSTPLIVSGEAWSPEALTAELIRHVIDQATSLHGSAPARVTLTHPASWHDFRLSRLRQAALLAGCEEAELVPEPVAAAWHYSRLNKTDLGQRLAVFDFGGATFDAAVLTVEAGGFSVVGEPKGLEQLGGIDLDEVVMAHVLEAARLDLATMEDSTENRRAVYRLRDDCRRAKEALSSDTKAHIPVMLPGQHTEIRITRAEFENVAHRSIERAVDVVEKTIAAAQLQPTDLDAVLLVGGSSRIPYVSQAISQRLALPVVSDAHPKHTIAQGATLVAERSERPAPTQNDSLRRRPPPSAPAAPFTRARASAEAPSPAAPPSDKRRGRRRQPERESADTAFTKSPTASPAVEIDRYDNLRPIGSGGFSQVYAAWQPNFDRKVAVKVLTVGSGLEVDQQAFELECRAMGSVSEHPNIVSVYDSGLTNGDQPFIAMELYQETLLDRIQSRGPIPVGEVLEMGVLLCGALQRAHDAGIFHRDIKPQNIFFSAYGTPALGDFGIASIASDRASQESMGMSMHYAAPEIIEGERPSVESDLYSLGATLYTALARQRPFMRAKGESEASFIQRVRTESPSPIVAQHVPRHVETAILGLLAKHRNDRPRSALELANILREQQTRLGLPATTVPLAEVDFDDDNTKPKQDASSSDLFSNDQTNAAVTGYKAKVQDRPTEEYREPDADRRGLLAAGVLVLALAVIGTGVFLSRGSDPEEVVTTSNLAAEPSTTTILNATAPDPPEAIEFTQTDEGIGIAWTAPDDAVRYRLTFTGELTGVESATEPEFEIEDPGGIVCVTVVAVNDRGRPSADSETECRAPSGE